MSKINELNQSISSLKELGYQRAANELSKILEMYESGNCPHEPLERIGNDYPYYLGICRDCELAVITDNENVVLVSKPLHVILKYAVSGLMPPHSQPSSEFPSSPRDDDDDDQIKFVFSGKKARLNSDNISDLIGAHEWLANKYKDISSQEHWILDSTILVIENAIIEYKKNGKHH